MSESTWSLLTTTPPLEPGSHIVPGYRLIKFLGRGGFGEVWEAEAPGEFRVALKFISCDVPRLESEVRALHILRHVRHPHLLDVQWAARIADRLVVAMPLCDRTLMARLEECRSQGLPGIPRDELLGYMSESAQALDYLNEPRHLSHDGRTVGIQHRDVKPSNIFLVGGAARVADFGLAKIMDQTLAEHSGPMTVAYAAPEFFRNQVSGASDQFSLAVTYVQLRTGHLPWASTAIQALISEILSGLPELSGLPAGEKEAVARALAKDPARRWPNCQAFVEALRTAPSTAGAGSSVKTLIDLLKEVRNKTVGLFQEARKTGVDLLFAPASTSNHILWHGGHALWLQDVLCLRLITGKSELPAGWEALFRMGSRPRSPAGPWPAAADLDRQLRAQLQRLQDVLGSVRDADLDRLPPHAHPGDTRTLGQCILHASHDEANHQGEMYLLMKQQWLNLNT